LSRSGLRGCRAVLFKCGCTPTLPFVNASALPGSRPSPLADLAPRILLRPSRSAWPSQSAGRSACGAESKWHLRLALPARASSARGRADATTLLDLTPIPHGGETTLARVHLRAERTKAAAGPSPRCHLPLWNGERVGGPGGGASSPWSPPWRRRNPRTDAFGQRFISALLVPELSLWLMRSSAVASAAAGRLPGTLHGA
jgi:hypothetical protein